MKFLKLFWIHKFSWKMWLRIIFSPLMITFVFIGGACEFGFNFLEGLLPKVNK